VAVELETCREAQSFIPCKKTTGLYHSLPREYRCLQFWGCSSDQRAGLERRENFIAQGTESKTNPEPVKGSLAGETDRTS